MWCVYIKTKSNMLCNIVCVYIYIYILSLYVRIFGWLKLRYFLVIPQETSPPSPSRPAPSPSRPAPRIPPRCTRPGSGAAGAAAAPRSRCFPGRRRPTGRRSAGREGISAGRPTGTQKPGLQTWVLMGFLGNHQKMVCSLFQTNKKF